MSKAWGSEEVTEREGERGGEGEKRAGERPGRRPEKRQERAACSGAPHPSTAGRMLLMGLVTSPFWW